MSLTTQIPSGEGSIQNDLSAQMCKPDDDSRFKLSWKTRISFSVGHVLNDLTASMWFTYLLVYFHLVLQFDNSLSGIVLLIGQIADGIATPFVGLQVGEAYSNPGQRRDQSTSRCYSGLLGKFGPRKTWHFFGTMCILASFPFIFMPCVGCSSSSQWAQVIYFSGFIVIFQFGWAAVQVSHLSLIPVLAHNESTRTELTALRYAFTVASNITIYAMTWVTLGVTGASQQVVGPEDASDFRDVVLIAIGIGALFSLFFHCGVDEVKHNQVYHSNKNESNSPAAMKAFDWLKEKQFYQVAVLYMATRLFVNLSQVYLPLWLQDNLKLGATSVATTPLALFVSGFLTSLAIGPLTQVVGRKVVYLIGALIGMGACLYVWFGHGEFFQSYGIYGVAALYGAGGSTMLITSLAVTADLIGPHVESGAFVYGAMSFTDKLSNGLTVFLIQYLHPCASCCLECKPYYVMILALVCGSAALLALMSLATMIPLDIGVLPKGYQRISSDTEDDVTPESHQSISVMA
ncbi:major facilitator superfamily domain-containing protein 12-like [Daphnia pulex]|uniref:major facilitator superfamily domain-containing protein 12-like n=1 Tax=Daphnia pulex TaxID=6669 RepID=UPI001EDE8447|nr:major facilitator superfamily domain-containing protein 12-like [Daphnia pulex]